MTEELKPCPFCGGKAEVRTLTYKDTKVYGIFCLPDLEAEYSHGHFIDNYANKQEAIAAWNRRDDSYA